MKHESFENYVENSVGDGSSVAALLKSSGCFFSQNLFFPLFICVLCVPSARNEHGALSMAL
jgi:hypothetical protein